MLHMLAGRIYLPEKGAILSEMVFPGQLKPPRSLAGPRACRLLFADTARIGMNRFFVPVTAIPYTQG